MLEILAGDIPLPAGEEPQPAPQFDEEATFTLRNPHGLHARPSAVLVKAVKQWRSQIRVENLDTRSAIVDAKNLMRVVSLGAKQGHRLHFMASGNDAQQALKAIGDAFNAGLGEIAAQPQQVSQKPSKRNAAGYPEYLVNFQSIKNALSSGQGVFVSKDDTFHCVTTLFIDADHKSKQSHLRPKQNITNIFERKRRL